MGFLSGAATVRRFAAARQSAFGEPHLARLRGRAAGPAVATADGVAAGWAATDSVLDADFTLEKNVYPDALVCDLRTVTNRPPADLLRAYHVAEVKALAANNPSGFASARQKREAKEAARARIEDEAKDGRFLKRKCDPVLWDGVRGEVYLGSASPAAADRLAGLFAATFGPDLTDLDHPAAFSPPLAAVTAATLALDRHDAAARAAPTSFVAGVAADSAWTIDPGRPDFLGAEFLLWLWFTLDAVTDTLTLPDGSEATLMLARTLALDCPRGVTGREAFRADGPTRLPEARRAIQTGKQPRGVGVTLVRHDQQFEFQLDDTLLVRSAKLPPADDGVRGRAAAEHRLGAARDLVEAVELVYFAFLDLRFGTGWAAELERVRRWVAGERKAVA